MGGKSHFAREKKSSEKTGGGERGNAHMSI